YVATFIQDDWRVSSRLTLNLGLRWDSDRPMTERFDRLSWFNFNAKLPVEVAGLPPLVGGLEFAAQNWHPRGVKNPDNNNFAPRVGLAFKATNRLVVRSGLGIFYNPTTGTGPGGPSVGALTFDAATNVTTSTDGGRTPYSTLSNPFPNGFIEPTHGSDGLLSLLGNSVNAQFRNDRTSYSAQWNFDLQFQTGKDSLLDVAYAGNTGVKLLASSQLNQIPDADLALGNALTQKVDNPFFGVVPASASLGQATTTAAQLLRPYPQFTGVQQTWGSMAHSSYHALQIKFRKRYGNGLQFLVSYAWSKLIDDFSTVEGFLGQQNPGYTDNNNRGLDRALSALDVAHHLVANYQYELPFGKGRHFLTHGPAGAVLGGWNINGITTIQSGLPISISSALNTTNSLGGGQRPNSTGISTRSPGSVTNRIDSYFNPAAFVDAPQFTFGNIGRLLPDNRGPYFIDWDISLLREIQVRESMHFELRGEFFNAFNNVNFQNPSGTTYGLPAFGSITSTAAPRIIQVAAKFVF
ncbi:MAG: TonB-dependent receptor domain-containing protein, partial [Bryobacteraceae bacterium]